MTFSQLGLSSEILQAIEKQGYTTPSPIQEKAIPEVLNDRDVLASAQTGTGKTAGFTLPIIEKLLQTPHHKKRAIKALIITPTRELAAQILKNVRDYTEFTGIRSTVIFGGVKQNSQVNALRQGIDILIATPGRLLDLSQQRLVDLRQVEMLVLDEADRMLDMGFLRDIKRIINMLPKERQNLLFSATFSKEIKVLAQTFLNNPVQIEVTPENTAVEIIEQKAYRVDKSQKYNVIFKLIDEGKWEQALIFTRTKHGANRLAEKLTKKGYNASAIHGNKSQNQRTKALDGFKNGRVRILVATDIAARGLDIPLLPHVVNFELPNIAEDYVHRIGRTGRAGAEGVAISLVDIEEVAYLRSIEKLIGEKIDTSEIEGFEPKNLVAQGKKGKTQGKGSTRSSGNRSKKPFGKSNRNNNNRNRR
ncbi:MAG: DEAD/DEAH box helicase [Crocinitomicaceae bacterium]